MDLAMVDSGTSTTRVRLWRDGSVAWSGSRDAGAATTAIDGHPGRIRDALTELLQRVEAETNVTPDAVICSGMITSNVGLFEVPHLIAPAGVYDLARGLVRHDLQDVTDAPMWFLPGVKTPTASSELEHLPDADMMRGEEAEIVGLRELLDVQSSATFLHFGSHHKAISIGPAGAILRSRTAITGELLAVIAGHTILKSSVAALHGLELDLAHARSGLRHARLHGLARTLFLVRVGEQAGRSKGSMTSYLLGALASEDLRLLEHVAPEESIILYGGGAFGAILEDSLEREGRDVKRVDDQKADIAAAVGAARIYHERIRLMRQGI